MSTFRDNQIRRYSRQILLREVGGRGQRRLLEAKVQILGLGPVGASCACYLAAAGVGALILEDPRPILQEDLGAGGLYEADDLKSPRQIVAARALSARNPDVSFPEISPEDTLVVMCGDAPPISGHRVGLRAGVRAQKAEVSWGCLSCAPAGLSEGEGPLGMALSLAAGTLAAYEAIRGILGRKSPLSDRHAWLDLGEMRYDIESLPCSATRVED